MSKSIVICDVDSTISPFCEALYERLIKIKPDFPTIANWTQWDLFQFGISKNEMVPIFNEIHLNQVALEPFAGAKELLDWLYDRYYVIIASHRDAQAYPMLVEWLNKYELKYHEVICTDDKTELFDEDVCFVIDDKPDTLRRCEELGILGIGLAWPWNVNKGFTLFDNLEVMLYWLKEIYGV